MRYSKIIFFAVLVIATACAKDKEADYVAAQEKTIDTFWASIDGDEYEKTINDDIYRIVRVKGDETQSISPGDMISFYYTGAVLTSSGITNANIFDTNIAAVATTIGLTTTTELKIREDIAGAGHFIDGLEKGLLQMHKGETAWIVFTSRHGYGDKAINIIPAYSPIIFEVYMVDVKKQ